MTREEYQAKRQAHVERLRERAEKAREASNGAYQTFANIIDRIPCGQPVLIGHHSERGHRADLAKMDRALGKSAEEAAKAEELERRANSAERSRAVFSDDPDAIAKLEAEIENEKASRELMKAANAAIRKHAKDGTEAQVRALEALGLKDPHGLLRPDFMGRVGFAGYALTNCGANIRRMEKRIEDLRALAATEHTEREVAGIRIVEDPEANRLRLFFPDKPDEHTRRVLKGSGFRWAPSEGAWQAYLTEQSRYRAQSIIANLAGDASLLAAK